MKSGRYIQQMLKATNLTRESVQEILRAHHFEAVEIGVQETNRIIKELQQGASLAGSLAGYEAIPVSRGAKLFDTPVGKVSLEAFEIVVEPRPDHKRFNSAKRPEGLNVFKILDTGRKLLPKLPESSGGGKKGKRKVYLLWSWEGERTLKVPVKSERNIKTGRYSYITGATFHAKTPIRAEPRGLTGRDRVPKGTKGFFTKGKLAAVPGRNLYKRILANIQKKLRAKGLPTDIVRLS